MTVTVAGRTFIVTGAGRGLGRGYALELAARGANIVVNDLGTSTIGEGDDPGVTSDVVEQIRAAGGRAAASSDDASTRQGTDAMVDIALRAFGRLDGVVANAGIIRAAIAFEDIDQTLLGRVVATNLLGPWHLCQAAWPHLKEQGRGRVVLVTSSAGIYGMAGNAAYALTKAGAIGLMRSLAAEGEPHGIKVNAISPHAWSRMANGVNDSTANQDDAAPGGAGLSALRDLVPISAVVPAIPALLCDELAFTGRIWSVGGRHAGRVFLGETRGVRFSEGFTAEDVQAGLLAMDDTTAPVVADSQMEAFTRLIKEGA